MADELNTSDNDGRGRSVLKSRWVLVATVVAALVVATGAVAASGVLSVGDKIETGQPPAPGQAPVENDEIVMATGSTPVGGPWQITTHKSPRVVDEEGTEHQPEGLPCWRIVLRDPPKGTPLPGGGYCGEGAGIGGFNVASVPASDGNGNIEVILWGPAPENAAQVELYSDNGKVIRTETQEGPDGYDGDFWVLAAPHTLKDAQVGWVSDDGQAGPRRLDASSDLERGYELESLNE